jgi:hypothetical protein
MYITVGKWELVLLVREQNSMTQSIVRQIMKKKYSITKNKFIYNFDGTTHMNFIRIENDAICFNSFINTDGCILMKCINLIDTEDGNIFIVPSKYGNDFTSYTKTVFLLREENLKGGRPQEQLLLNVETFKALCMLAMTIKCK